jgi:hypothetical protein
MAWGGSPASSRISTSLRADNGVSLAGLMQTAFPAARAGPTLWATRFRGKLKGVMAATMPQGTRSVNPSLPLPPGAASRGMTSLPMRRASSADTSMVSRARLASKVPSARVLPSSWLIVRPSSGSHACMSAAARRKIAERSYADMSRISRAPSTSPSTARFTSSGVP